MRVLAPLLVLCLFSVAPCHAADPAAVAPVKGAVVQVDPAQAGDIARSAVPPAVSAGPTVPAGRKLVVGTKETPPFSFKTPAGEWTGVAIELWRDVAAGLGLTYELREYDPAGLVRAIADNEVDLAVAALSVTMDREKIMDFSHPFFLASQGIAVPSKPAGSIFGHVLSSLLSWPFLSYLLLLLITLLSIGVVIWMVERRSNPEHFRPGKHGVLDGLWWSAVTMTTVGYGDSFPRSFPGRVLALIWMFASVILLSFFTAGITTSVTVERITGKIEGPADLYDVLVGTVASSSAEEFLLHEHIHPKRFSSPEQGLEEVAHGRLDAFVFEEPTLRYFIRKGFYADRVDLLEAVFDPHTYAFAFPWGSDLRKPVNVELLEKLEDKQYWKQLTGPFLGSRK